MNIQQAEKDAQDLLRQHGLLDKWQSYREQQLKRIAKQNAVRIKQALGIKLAFILLAASTLVASCQDRFRYECQDPMNWSKPDCNPPKCEADGTCTKYLLKGTNEN
jgi:hypothetical protein